GNFGNGITISGGSHLVEGNYIGTDVTGTKALGNGYGIFMGAVGTTIGGAASGEGNLISGNQLVGVYMSGGVQNAVQGNTIGTDVTGTKALGNGADGVVAQVESNDIIGGATSGAGNLISAILGDAVALLSRTSGTSIQGNTS